MTALKIKIMPESLEVSLPELQKKAEEKASSLGGLNISFVEEPIAFGLKALIITLAWPEQLDTDKIESALGKLPGVSSSQIIDYRRAFG